ncbi:MAG: MATE family efflux transporter [Myxococcota bacterium]|nr:MATE family efflux transporter [Myxococcota bacterium]
MLVDFRLWGRILRLSTPVVIAMLTQTAINLMDTIMVGWLDPSYSIAGQSALGYSLPLLWSVGGFLSSISVGTLAISARRLGEDDIASSGATLTNSVSVAGTLGLLASIAAFFAVPYVFPLLNDNESVLAFGVPYAQYRLLGVLSMVTTISYKSFFDGIGQTHVHMVAALIMNGTNIVLNYLLIFGIGPFPAMYVEGAGLASLISTYIGLALMIGWTFLPRYLKKFKYYRVKNLAPRVMWDIVKLSVPSGLATVFVMTGFLLFLKIVGILDEQAVSQTLAALPAYSGAFSEHFASLQHQVQAAYDFHGRIFAADLAFMAIEARPPIYTSATKVIMDILSVTFMSAIAFGTGTATLVSQSLGRGEPQMATRYGWESVKLAAVIYGVLGLVTFIFPEQVLGLLSRDPAVIDAAIPSLRMLAAVESVMAGALILTQALFGAGATRFIMWVELILHSTCLVPLSYLFGIVLDWGLPGIWASVIIYVSALAVVIGIKFHGGSWKSIKV